MLHYLDAGSFDDEPADWRRLTYRITGPNSYEERIHSQTPEGWKELGAFDFLRKE